MKFHRLLSLLLAVLMLTSSLAACATETDDPADTDPAMTAARRGVAMHLGVPENCVTVTAGGIGVFAVHGRGADLDGQRDILLHCQIAQHGVVFIVQFKGPLPVQGITPDEACRDGAGLGNFL